MKDIFQKIGSISMALLVLFSTLSFTVDKHFCGSVLVDKAIFSEAKTCGMEADSDSMANEDSCCKEQKVHIEGQDELKHSFQDLDFQQQVFLTAFTIASLELFEINSEALIPFRHYSPPLLVSDIHLLDQVFLI